MQKKLIAAAVAALASSAAMAQVTLYGVADAAYFGLNQERVPTGGAAGQLVEAKTSGVVGGLLSGSRLGVKVEDDIGGGMKGVVVYESAINIDSSSTAAGNSGMFGFTRQSYVGLTGGFGRVSLGRQYAPGYFAALASDGFAGAAISPQSALSAGASMMITPNSGARVDNSINYVSNSMGGVTLNVLYGMGETADTSNVTAAGTTSKSNQRVGIGAQGKFGPVTVDAVYETRENALATNGTQTQDEYLIGAAFNAGFATFGASYQVKELDGGAVTPAVTAGNDSELVSVSAVVPVGAGNIHVGYAMLTRDTAIESEVTALTVAYTHALSKKTTAYVGYSQAESNENATAITSATGLGGPLGAIVANGTNSVLAAGLRVVF